MSSGQFWKDIEIIFAKEALEKSKLYAKYLLGNAIFGQIQSYYTASYENNCFHLNFFRTLLIKVLI
jgi:hypothetical protein